MKVCRFAIFLIIFWMSVVVSGAAEKSALVIGIADYHHSPKLKNPVNDARAVEQSLKKQGFEVDLLCDPSLKDLSQAIEAFRKKPTGGLRLLYLAGGSVEIKGKIYMMPVDAEVASADSVETQSLCLDTIFRPTGNYAVLYSTHSGGTAADGNEDISPFCDAWLKAIDRSNHSLPAIVRDTKVGMAAAAPTFVQIPRLELFTDDDFVLNPVPAKPVTDFTLLILDGCRNNPFNR